MASPLEDGPRFNWLGRFRKTVRGTAFSLLRQALVTDDGRRILADALEGSLNSSPTIPRAESPPYTDLGRAETAADKAPVFITGRFRSGSTLLWNIFRQVGGCTAFYEPLNERRWFDSSSRGNRVDGTHVGVSDYWREYEGLSHLGDLYRRDWIDRHLYMNAGAWDPDLHGYIQALIDAAPERPVLQFNRIDFRLPWIRHHFPKARLIHLFRHPREQWCSSLVDVTSFPRDGSVASFEAYDHFYLLAWAKDLSLQFPFLDPRRAAHPYDLFYLIWKLSYLFGRGYCDASFCLETLCATPSEEIPRLMAAAAVLEYDVAALSSIVKPQATKWPAYADQAWFERREARCETVLSRALEGG